MENMKKYETKMEKYEGNMKKYERNMKKHALAQGARVVGDPLLIRRNI